MESQIIKLLREEKGQGIIEYAMILGLVALIVVLAVQAFGLGIEAFFNQVDNGIAAVQGLFGP